MAFSESLARRVRAWFSKNGPALEEKRMMGGLCFMVDGKMCLGVEKDRLMVRLDPAVYEEALARPGCKPMDFTGRPMKGFVWVETPAIKTARSLTEWITLALEFNPRAIASRKASPRTKPRTPRAAQAAPQVKITNRKTQKRTIRKAG